MLVLILISNKFITFVKMKSSELLRLLKRDGWYVVRQSGSHMILEHPVKKGKSFVLTMAVTKWVKAWSARSKRTRVLNNYNYEDQNDR